MFVHSILLHESYLNTSVMGDCWFKEDWIRYMQQILYRHASHTHGDLGSWSPCSMTAESMSVTMAKHCLSTAYLGGLSCSLVLWICWLSESPRECYENRNVELLLYEMPTYHYLKTMIYTVRQLSSPAKSKMLSIPLLEWQLKDWIVVNPILD